MFKKITHLQAEKAGFIMETLKNQGVAIEKFGADKVFLQGLLNEPAIQTLYLQALSSKQDPALVKFFKKLWN